MKKTIPVILTVLMALSLVSCSGVQVNVVKNDVGNAAADTPTADISPNNEENTTDEEYYGPDDFVQYQSGKLEFTDYDEIISCLEPGQGWTKIKVLGCDEDVLAVTEKVESDGSAGSASFYRMKDGKPVEMSNAGSNDPKYPLRYADGIIYCGGEHSYESDIVSTQTGGLMVKDYVFEGTGNDAGTYTGFLRPSNDFGDDKEFTGGKEEYNMMISEMNSKPVLTFTKIQ